MRVHLQALGCRLNEAELESWARDFRSQGFELANETSDADIVVVNTCAVTQESVKKSRNLIRRAQRQNPQAKLIMSGCYAALSPEQAANDLGVDLVVGNHEKDRLVEIAQQALSLPIMPVSAIEPGEVALLSRGRQRAFIKVQDGCRYRCTYCVVTLARGNERSRSIEDVVEEIKTLEASGIQEVVLTGVHLGGYGSDCDSNLYQLIEAVLRDTQIPRVRLGSLEPWDLPENFWSLFSNPRLMPHLHLPMQSGADSVLRRMSRRCRSGEFIQLVDDARAQVPGIVITTDIIVGFPGETQDEWQQTLDFVERCQFGHIHIFAYSHRDGTKAATLPGVVDRNTKRQRSEQLHQLAAKHKQAELARHIGQRFEVLIEGKPQTDESSPDTVIWGGYTPNYLRIQLQTAADMNLENQLVQVKINALAPSAEALSANIVSH